VLTSAYPVDPAVLGLCHVLHHRGLLADVHVVSVCGDLDVRLVTCREGSAVTVELLASLAADPHPARWHAVQVRGAERQVFRGPDHDAPTALVADFLESLLEPGPVEVPYPRLG
jgi:hypothetical protein